MKVTHINATDIVGGAARAAYRLHRGLLDQGVNSRMLVQSKRSQDPTVDAIYSDSKFGKLYSQLRPSVNSLLQKLQKTTNTITHSANFLPSGLHKQINNSDADIVHLHWVGEETISIKEISKIKKPIVWTLHDMWAFSGSEHYEDLQFPDRYKEGYIKDRRPPTYTGFDIDQWTWKRKRKYWQDKNFYLVTPSNWLTKCARESILFKKKDIQTIPYGLNLNVYKPIPKKWSRHILNITENRDKRYILFGAMSATSDSRKGYKELKKALTVLAKNGNNNHLLIFGSEGYKNIDFGLPTTYLGQLDDDETLALSYSAADVMVVPSLQDNLPNTAIEAIACGTPVVAFNIGGLSDITDHRKNGYLAEPFKSEDFANGIEWVLKDTDHSKKLSLNARKKAVETYEMSISAKKYSKLYNEVIGKKKI